MALPITSAHYVSTLDTGDGSGVVSGVIDAGAGAVSGAVSGAAGGDSTGLVNAGVGAATSAAANAAAGAAQSSGLTNVVSAGMQLLATAQGAYNAATAIGASISSGDWLSAGQQALALAKASGVGSSDAAIQAGLSVAAKGAALGGTIGSVFPIVGNVVGAVIGAIAGFIAGVATYVEGNVIPGDSQPSQDLAAWMESGYLVLRTAGKADHKVRWPMDDATVGSRGWYWGNYFPTLYAAYQGSGAVQGFNFGPFGPRNVPDWQPALNQFLGGLARDTPPLAPLEGQAGPGFGTLPMMDYALWLAARKDGMAILQKQPAELQSTILPVMPQALATLIYMTLVPVLAAPGHYVPAAVEAVRQAAAKMGTQAGSQVSDALSLSLPSDDVALIQDALTFVTDPHSLLLYVTAGQQLPLWTGVVAPLKQMLAEAKAPASAPAPVLFLGGMRGAPPPIKPVIGPPSITVHTTPVGYSFGPNLSGGFNFGGSYDPWGAASLLAMNHGNPVLAATAAQLASQKIPTNGFPPVQPISASEALATIAQIAASSHATDAQTQSLGAISKQVVDASIQHAKAGHPIAVYNAQMLDAAQRIAVQAGFVSKYVSAAAGQSVLHAAGKAGALPLGLGTYDRQLPRVLEQAVTAMLLDPKATTADLRRFAAALMHSS